MELVVNDWTEEGPKIRRGRRSGLGLGVAQAGVGGERGDQGQTSKDGLRLNQKGHIGHTDPDRLNIPRRFWARTCRRGSVLDYTRLQSCSDRDTWWDNRRRDLSNRGDCRWPWVGTEAQVWKRLPYRPW